MEVSATPRRPWSHAFELAEVITWLRLPKPSVFQRNPRRPAWTNCRSEFLPRARSPFARGAPATRSLPHSLQSGSPLRAIRLAATGRAFVSGLAQEASGDEGARGDRHGSQWIRGLGAEGSEAGEECATGQPPATSTFHASANAAMSARARTNASHRGPTSPAASRRPGAGRIGPSRHSGTNETRARNARDAADRSVRTLRVLAGVIPGRRRSGTGRSFVGSGGWGQSASITCGRASVSGERLPIAGRRCSWAPD